MMTVEEGTGFGVYAAENRKAVDLAMQRIWLSGTLLPVGARLLIRHDFQSGEKRPLEVVYTFMLPRDAGMSSFRIVGEGFEVHSELRPTEEAEAIYEKGIDEGHLAAMTASYRDGIVNLNVGNIRPGETVSVFLEIVSGVELNDAGFRFRFPFTIAQSYHARATVAPVGPDTIEMTLPEDEFGNLILPPWKSDNKDLHEVGFDVTIELPVAIDSVSSPSHPIAVRRKGETAQQVHLAIDVEVPNRDLVLDVKYAQETPLVLAGKDSTGKGRLAAVVPSRFFGEPDSQLPRRVVFLIDRSGSMEGSPIRQACLAVQACLGALTDKDEFGIVAFDDHAEIFTDKPVRATQENREKARTFLDGIDARGGTEMAMGLMTSAKVLGKTKGDILILTDGQVYGGEDVVRRVEKTGMRLHCLGIGLASQDRFLTILARNTGGTCHFMTPEENVAIAVMKTFASISEPVANELKCAVATKSKLMIEPEIQTDVLSGPPLLLLASWTGTLPAKLNLKWENGTSSEQRALPILLQEGDLGETLRRIQGARLITDAETAYDGSGASTVGEKRKENRIKTRLLSLSDEYGLASRAMTLVAVAERKGDQKGKIPTTTVVPLGLTPNNVRALHKSSLRGGHAMLACAHYLMEPVIEVKRYALSANSLTHKRAAFLGAAPSAPPIQPKADSEFHETISEEYVNAIQLVDLSSRLASDGGLPGRDEKTRIAASLLGLLCLYLHESDIFKRHIQRLWDFLTRQDGECLTKLQQGVLKKVLAAEKGTIQIPNLWEDFGRRLYIEKEAWSPKVFWKAISKAVDE